MTSAEKHLINEAIKRIDVVKLEQWLKDAKRWRKNWSKKEK